MEIIEYYDEGRLGGITMIEYQRLTEKELDIFIQMRIR